MTKSTLRDEQKRRTRRALIDAAKSLFVARGYSTVTVDDITREVGCSRATFYLHFTGKMDVLAKISAETMQERAAAVYRDLDVALTDGSREAFTGWIRHALDWFSTNRDILPAWDEALAVEPEFHAIGRASITALSDAMPGYLARWPANRRDEARFRIELLVTQLERYFTRSQIQGTIEFSPEQAADVLSDIWFPALAPPGKSGAPVPPPG
ncbi:TetR/AcrR family transcriptional regulator [Gordonia sp. (in: high G+C Gram-positive bacteria)]|uniref:TetR/AcrR family transcriptional regulator n=1 Tax=Gordonia sp. (in: high G+C Gram-positive bacteria) TaxID=84139 RepID=UPI003F9CA171